MSIEIVAESPLAKALQSVVQPKLVEMGWSSDTQDDTLSEYIILMLANGKSQDQIAVELATDLLDLGPNDQSTKDFSGWLFAQVYALNLQLNGPAAATDQAPAPENSNGQESSVPAAYDDDDDEMDMGDAPAGSSSVPTGPKSMRGGAQRGRDRRMLGQMNKTLNQSNDATLHRIRGAAGGGRINSHGNRDVPKGPRNQNMQRNVATAINRGAANSAMGQQGGMPQMPQMPQAGNVMNPQDQMQFLATLAEQAQVMAWQMQQMGVPMPGMNGNGNGNGRSMFDRVDKRHNRRGGHQNGGHQRHEQNGAEATGENGGGDMEMGENGASTARDPSHTVCRFDTTCGKADCHFAHHSPIARPGSMLPEINMEQECSFGLACKNFSCPDRHESRAKKMAHQAEQECMFGLFCQKPHCPFQHPPPTMKPCRNGADCTTPNCPFWHSKIECKHNPCKNAMCPYKHKAGQKEAKVGGNVWTAEGAKNHISERKFVDEDGGPEELITGKQESGLIDAPAQPVVEAEMIS